jgi:hypothetical protein
MVICACDHSYAEGIIRRTDVWKNTMRPHLKNNESKKDLTRVVEHLPTYQDEALSPNLCTAKQIKK